MDARSLATIRTSASADGNLSGDKLVALFVRWIGCSLYASVALASLVCCARRLSGALWQPLSSANLLMLAIALAAWAQGMRQFDLATVFGSLATRWRRHAWLLPAPVLLLSVVSVSLPGISATGLVAFWTLLVAEEILAWRQSRYGFPFVFWKTRNSSPLAPPRIILNALPADQVDAETSEFPASDVLQQLIRRRGAFGRENISGWIRANFAAAQRTTAVHVAFCPPLVAAPQFSAEQADGPAATIKATHIYPHGARVEIKLDAPAVEPASVLFEFSAWDPAAEDDE